MKPFNGICSNHTWKHLRKTLLTQFFCVSSILCSLNIVFLSYCVKKNAVDIRTQLYFFLYVTFNWD